MEKFRCVLSKTRTVFGTLEDGVMVRVCIGKLPDKIYVERSDEPYVDIFSLDNPSLLVRDPELVKKILVKDFLTFMDRQNSTDEKTGSLISSTFFVLNGQRWREVRTSFRPLFSTGKMKTMLCLVDVCGKELAACM